MSFNQYFNGYNQSEVDMSNNISRMNGFLLQSPTSDTSSAFPKNKPMPLSTPKTSIPVTPNQNSSNYNSSPLSYYSPETPSNPNGRTNNVAQDSNGLVGLGVQLEDANTSTMNAPMPPTLQTPNNNLFPLNPTFQYQDQKEQSSTYFDNHSSQLNNVTPQIPRQHSQHQPLPQPLTTQVQPGSQTGMYQFPQMPPMNTAAPPQQVSALSQPIHPATMPLPQVPQMSPLHTTSSQFIPSTDNNYGQNGSQSHMNFDSNGSNNITTESLNNKSSSFNPNSVLGSLHLSEYVNPLMNVQNSTYNGSYPLTEPIDQSSTFSTPKKVKKMNSLPKLNASESVESLTPEEIFSFINDDNDNDNETSDILNDINDDNSTETMDSIKLEDLLKDDPFTDIVVPSKKKSDPKKVTKNKLTSMVPKKLKKSNSFNGYHNSNNSYPQFQPSSAKTRNSPSFSLKDCSGAFSVASDQFSFVYEDQSQPSSNVSSSGKEKSSSKERPTLRKPESMSFIENTKVTNNKPLKSMQSGIVNFQLSLTHEHLEQ